VPPYIDPPLGGYLGAPRCDPTTQPECLAGDTPGSEYPFYYNDDAFLGCSYYQTGIVTGCYWVQSAYLPIQTANTLTFRDAPKDSFWGPLGLGATFNTKLVGVRQDGAVVNLLDFSWASNFNGTVGGIYGISPVSVVRNNYWLPVDQGSGTGGIAITSINGVPLSDTTPPVIISQVSGTLGNNGWYRSNVSVTWSVSDPESGITSSKGCGSTVLNAETAGITLSCLASNGVGVSASASVTIKIDLTPPVASATVSRSPDANGWNNTNVTVTFTGTDNLSGIDFCSAPITFGNEGAAQTASGTCTDKAGNVSAPATAKMNIDKTPAVISGMAGAGCTLWPPNHKLVTVATVTAADALSGLAPGSFTMSGTSSEPATDPKSPDIVITPTGAGGFIVQLRADRLGNGSGRTYTLSATANDLAGNTATLTASCTVPHDQGQE